MRKLLVFLACIIVAGVALADGMMHVGVMMPAARSGGSSSGAGILTESNDLITTESGDPLRTE